MYRHRGVQDGRDEMKRSRFRHWELLACVAIASTMLSLVTLNSAQSQLPCPNSSNCDEEGILNGNFTCSDGREVQFPFNCSDLCGNDSNGTQCATFDDNICVQAVCAGGNCSMVEEYVPPSCQDDNPCTNNSCDVCANNCTGECVSTPIMNASICDLDDGATCENDGQCSSTFCVDGVCCNAACTGAGQSCTMSGFVGQCVAPAPAPAVSWQGMLVIGLLLSAIGLFGLRALRRS